MEEIKPKDPFRGSEEFYSMEDEDGVIRCSCGRELEQQDEETWQCPGGYPVYRFTDGSVTKDKFGNLMLKKIEHPDGNGDTNG